MASDLFFQDPNPQGCQPVLLLHGLGVHSDSWQMQVPALIQAGLRPIIPDLPGFGRSPWSGKRWSINKVAGMVADLMDELAINNAFVAGISMGGVVAQQLILDHPDRVQRLVLINTFSRLRPVKPNEWLYFLKRVIYIRTLGLKAQADTVAWRLFPRPEHADLREAMKAQVMESDEHVYRAALTALGLFDSSRRLRSIAIPTLVISGACDTTVSLANQTFLARMIPSAQHLIIPDAGHAVTVDQPYAINTALIAFLISDHSISI